MKAVWKNTSRYLLFLAFFGVITTVRAQDYRAYVFLAEECPISIAMANPLRETFNQHNSKVAFYAVFPNIRSDEISMRAFLGRYRLDFEPILDPDQTLSARLGAKVTPEVIVLDAQDQVVYQGRITDAYSAPGKVRHGKYQNDFAGALNTLLSGKIVSTPWPEAIGCFITFFNPEE